MISPEIVVHSLIAVRGQRGGGSVPPQISSQPMEMASTSPLSTSLCANNKHLERVLGSRNYLVRRRDPGLDCLPDVAHLMYFSQVAYIGDSTQWSISDIVRVM
jgi:hypothetical protein